MLGFLKGSADGAFGPGTSAAVEAFQKAAGLPSTGDPDVRTLIALFYSAPAAGRRRRPPERPVGRTGGSTGRLGCHDPAPAGQPPAKLDLNLAPAPQ